MDDQIGEGLCSMLHRLWRMNIGGTFNDYCIEDTVENIKPYTVDGVPIRKLFIGNLAQRTTHKDLEKLFSTYGKLDSCYLKRNTGKSNYAFVTFNNMDDALKATKDGHKKRIHLHHRDLRVMPADSWHQPDCVENQSRKTKKSLDSSGEELSTPFELNDDAAIHKLNDDCLMHIFMFLPIVDRVKMELVCKRWRMISHESWRTFKKLDLKQSTWGFDTATSGPREIDTPTLRKVLLRCGLFLTHIDFSMFADKLSKSTLTVVGRLCPNLQVIDVTGLNVSPAGIKSLTNHCTNILEFSLGHCSNSCDNDLSGLFLRNKKLKYIKLVQNSVTGKCLLNLPTDSIETVKLSECTSVSPCHFSNAVQTFKNLHTLSLEKCVSINDQAVKAISTCFKSLKVLQLCDYYPMIRMNCMPHLAELVNLETLDVSQNLVVQDEFLIAIGNSCKQLRIVDISSCHLVTNKGLAGITSLPQLEILNINYLGKIDDEVLSDMPNLKTLQCRGCPSLKDTGLSALIEESHSLELADFSGCNFVSNELVEVAIKATKARTNNIVLKMYVGKTKVNPSEIKTVSPFLQVLNVDLSDDYLRPDFDHDQYDFFPNELYDMDFMDDFDPFHSDDVDDEYDADDLFDYVGRNYYDESEDNDYVIDDGNEVFF